MKRIDKRSIPVVFFVLLLFVISFLWRKDRQVKIEANSFFLVQFSSKNPQQSRIFYEYQLPIEKIEYKNYTWDTIPTSILQYRKKKDKFW